jgi:hypothetical protein
VTVTDSENRTVKLMLVPGPYVVAEGVSTEEINGAVRSIVAVVAGVAVVGPDCDVADEVTAFCAKVRITVPSLHPVTEI